MAGVDAMYPEVPKLRAAAIMFITCVSFWVAPSIAASNQVSRFGVGGTAVLCPPISDLDPLLIPYNPVSTDLVVGSGRTPGFAFLFDKKIVQGNINPRVFKVFPSLDAIRSVNSLSGVVGFLSVADSLRLGPAMRARDLSDEWYKTDRCAHSISVPMGRSNLVEVKCSAVDNFSNVLNVTPDGARPMPTPNSIVIASCNEDHIPVGPFAGATLHPCRRVVIHQGFMLDYQIQRDNVPLYSDIDSFLFGKIEEWRRNCSR